MKIEKFDWDKPKIGYFTITGYLKDSNFSYLYDIESSKEIRIVCIQEKSMIQKILKLNTNITTICMIIQIRHTYKKANIDDIYRIEVLDGEGNIIDSVNTHQDGVPKDIRDEFDEKYRV